MTFTGTFLSRAFLIRVPILMGLLAFMVSMVDSSDDAGSPEAWVRYLIAGAVLGAFFVAIQFGFNILKIVFAKNTFPIHFEISPEGVRVDARGFRGRYDWAFYTGVYFTSQYAVFGIDRQNGVTIPRQCIPDNVDWQSFCQFCVGHYNLASAEVGQ
jgi:hypothetical protein